MLYRTRMTHVTQNVISIEDKTVHIGYIAQVLNISHICFYSIWLEMLHNTFLSHNNPCFQCNIAITIFLVSHTCEIRFNDVIGRSSVPIYSYAKIPKHG